MFGCIGETEYIVARLKKELNIPNAVVAVTGGMCRIIASGTENVFDYVEPSLILEGLLIIYKMNRK
jgi:type III pantothenate kinase